MASCAATGCVEAAPVRCELGEEQVVAVSGAKDFDGIALLPHSGGAIALWAQPDGLYGRRLSAQGVPEGRSRRLWPGCGGGFATVAEADALRVACLSPAGGGKHTDAGGVWLLELSFQLELRDRRQLGVAGSLSEGVSMARVGGALQLVWQDASPDRHGVFWRLVSDASPALQRAEPRMISRRGHLAAAPSIAAAADGTPRVVWAERWVDGKQLRSEVVSWRGKGQPQTALPLAHLNAMPRLVELDGGLLLAFRDQPDKQRKPGLYLARLDAHGAPREQPVRVGRADGIGHPELRACMGGLVTATPRTYGGDYFIGINWLDAALETTRGEQQFYEDTHAFTRAAAACVGDGALILVAEFGQLHRATTRLSAVPYRCR